MKKYAFFKYFMKNRVFVDGCGGGGGAGRPVLVGDGVECPIFTFNMIWGRGRGRVHGSGGGDADGDGDA